MTIIIKTELRFRPRGALALLGLRCARRWKKNNNPLRFLKRKPNAILQRTNTAYHNYITRSRFHLLRFIVPWSPELLLVNYVRAYNIIYTSNWWCTCTTQLYDSTFKYNQSSETRIRIKNLYCGHTSLLSEKKEKIDQNIKRLSSPSCRRLCAVILLQYLYVMYYGRASAIYFHSENE